VCVLRSLCVLVCCSCTLAALHLRTQEVLETCFRGEIELELEKERERPVSSLRSDEELDEDELAEKDVLDEVLEPFPCGSSPAYEGGARDCYDGASETERERERERERENESEREREREGPVRYIPELDEEQDEELDEELDEEECSRSIDDRRALVDNQAFSRSSAVAGAASGCVNTTRLTSPGRMCGPRVASSSYTARP
jgi:hypothetical protein